VAGNEGREVIVLLSGKGEQAFWGDCGKTFWSIAHGMQEKKWLGKKLNLLRSPKAQSKCNRGVSPTPVVVSYLRI
jgi:hypothetical protein